MVSKYYCPYETATGGVFSKQVFLEMSQNSQENTYAGVLQKTPGLLRLYNNVIWTKNTCFLMSL